ncbi:MAG: TIGR04255 family protein [Burkholderiales bacterium]|nr:TIGR04255 family protein [Burkholderiales bacterium]
MNPTRLARPPIREAVLDIRTEGPENLAAIKELAESYGRESGMKKGAAIRAGVIEMAIAPDKPISGGAKDIGLIGHRVEDEPATRVAQFKKDGFTFSLIGNYQTWEVFRDQAMVPARRFLQLPGLGRVNRVALRYINIIQFPSQRVDLDEYLPAAPKVPSELPQEVAGFISRIVLPIAEDGLMAIVTQALDEAPQPTPSVILDVDVFSQEGFQPSWDALAPVFEKIRIWKNRIFFAYVNENTVRLHS